jgi:tetratricopeptide (TPR) repeat protein
MAPVSFTTGLAVAFFLLPGLAAAGPSLTGSYRAEPYGTLELKTEGEHVTGLAGEGTACGFDAQRQVLEGDFQGSVLVARLIVCQTGDICPAEQTYSILGFYNETDNVVVAHVRLGKGCQSPALPESGQFILQLAPPQAPGQTPTSASSAMELANKRGVRSAEAAKQALEQGLQLYRAKNYQDANRRFEISLSHDGGDRNWPAYLWRGSSLLKLGKVDDAIKDLERARVGNTVSGVRDPAILYMLGCAYGQKGDKGKALDHLTRAVKAGYRLHEGVAEDPELTRTLAGEPQFQELLKRSREKKPQPRGTVGTGTPSP